MPSFDVVSQVDWPEVANAVDQANREIRNRYDFKGTDARIEQSDEVLSIYADSEFQVEQAADILNSKLAGRKIDLGCLEPGPVKAIGGDKARKDVVIRHGIGQETGKKIVKIMKESKLKTQASVQGDQVRIAGKKRDDLQQAIAMLREVDLGLPLQYVNFRD
ncbi:YajQ family cyclic di-GMP-binding protein [Pseudomonadota bacterium]